MGYGDPWIRTRGVADDVVAGVYGFCGLTHTAPAPAITNYYLDYYTFSTSHYGCIVETTTHRRDHKGSTDTPPREFGGQPQEPPPSIN